MTLLIVIIILALVFDFINGFHDAANSIATVVSTKVLTPLQAVIWAAIFNFVAFFIFKDHGVADTVSKTVHKEFVTLPVIISGLVGAITWNLLTWWRGIPSSSSHTLIGGFAGAAIAHAGFQSIDSSKILTTASFIFLAPLLGMIMAFIISTWFLNSFRKGIFPKLLSIAIIVAVSWWVYSKLYVHPDQQSVKAKDVTIFYNFQPIDGFAVVFYGESTHSVNSAWDKVVAGPSEFGSDSIRKTTQVHIPEISSLPLIVYSKVTEAKGQHGQLVAGFLADSIGVNRVLSEAEQNRASGYLVKLSKDMIGRQPVKFMNVIFSKDNFKWILLGFILVIMAGFTLWLHNLNNAKAGKWFKRLQLISSAAFSIGHGGNDAQKVMGIITAALIADGQIGTFGEMPTWVPLACYTAIALGTMSGGWKIVKTMGTRITKVTPFEGVAAETAGAITLFLTENLKIPVSTTHTITGSIIGVGATKRLSAVRWGVTVNLLWAWILTIPVSGMMSALVYFIFYLSGNT
ncbi:MAG TPA: inorganic phosphate transporter [Bacteroidia bacterium]|nr:inorganic phosphate transporter [Bacteroidia bacterium]